MIIARIDNELTPRTPYRRGRSFKGLLSYLFNGARHEPHPERVLHAETVNIWSDLRDAAHEMASTWEARFRLMQAEGLLPKNGADNKAPVYHFVISWRADEDPPDPKGMADHAKQLLQLLGLGEHEAVLVVHGDTANPHIHVIANTVHPITGRTASLRFDKRIMQDYAARYEDLRERIVCKARFRDRGAEGQPRNRRVNRPRWTREADAVREAKSTLLPSVVLEQLTRNASTFTPAQLARAITAATVTPREFTALMAALMASPDLIRLEDDDKHIRYSTRTQKETEDRLADAAVGLAGDIGHPVTTSALATALSSFSGTDQAGTRAALQHLLDERGLSIVVGYAGAGKSTLLRTAANAWNKSGYRMRGLALAGRAAEGLEADAGISSGTIAAFLLALDNGTTTLSKRDVLVIDEAGMVGSRQLERVLSSARSAGAKVVLVGDPEQLQAIEAGGPFRYLVETFDHARLSTVWRQRTEWMRTATRQLAEGATEAAFTAYERNGSVRSHGTSDEAINAILDEWQEGRDAGMSQLILTATNADARAINSAARERLKALGVLGRDHGFELADESLSLAVGDRILFRKNDRTLKVKNGTTGIVTAIDGGNIVVAIDGTPPRAIRVDLATYPHVTHGYAVTIHKSQGATVDRAFILASPLMDRHSAYVALSRHRTEVALHWSEDRFADRAAVVRRLSRARLKDVTLDYEEALALSASAIIKAARNKTASEIGSWARLYDTQRRERAHYESIGPLRRAFWLATNAHRLIRARATTLDALHAKERRDLAAALKQARNKPKNRRGPRVSASEVLMGRKNSSRATQQARPSTEDILMGTATTSSSRDQTARRPRGRRDPLGPTLH